MKLSEALMLASMNGEKPTNDSWDHCLFGLACHAVGVDGRKERFECRWQWLYFPNSLSGDGWNLLTGLCNKVQRGELSIQQAAEIVRQVEPEELAVGETRNEQADLGQGPRIATVEEIGA